MTVSETLQSGNRPDYTLKKTKLGLRLNLWTKELQITCQNVSPKFARLSCENRLLCLPSQYLNVVLGIVNTPYLLTDNELGDREDIDRSALPQITSIPSTSVILGIDFSGFRVDFSVDKSTHVTGFTRHGLSR